MVFVGLYINKEKWVGFFDIFFLLEWNNVWFIVNVIGFVISVDRCGLYGEEFFIFGLLFFVV